jgi:HK97 family phage major capsid protein
MEDIKLDATFTEDQKKVAVALYKKLKDEVDSEMSKKLGEFRGEDEFADTSEDGKLALKDRKRLDQMTRLWKSNGYVDGAKERIKMEDLFRKDIELTSQMRDNFSTDHPLLLPRTISTIAREAIEPNLVLTSLLQRISFSNGTRIVFPSWGGAMQAADLSEGEEYPEGSMELAGQVEATIGKSGIALKVTEETIRYSLYDVVSMQVRAAGRAMARLKEKKAADLITADYGTTVIDNTSASYKSSTGRDAAGAYNGTLTLDDIFAAYATMVDRGFTPNTLIMHPFAWQIFAQEGIARAFGFHNGMSPLMWQMPQGSAGNAANWRVGGLNQNTYVSQPQQLATTFTNVPSPFPTTFKIVVTPYMPYNASTLRTDIVLCDSNELGLLVVDEELTTDEWTDPARDIKKIKMRERYGLAVMNDGRGIGLMKGIRVGKSYDFADKIMLQLSSLTSALTLDGQSGVI